MPVPAGIVALPLEPPFGDAGARIVDEDGGDGGARLGVIAVLVVAANAGDTPKKKRTFQARL